jgi:hypothetical protein
MVSLLHRGIYYLPRNNPYRCCPTWWSLLHQIPGFPLLLNSIENRLLHVCLRQRELATTPLTARLDRHCTHPPNRKKTNHSRLKQLTNAVSEM